MCRGLVYAPLSITALVEGQRYRHPASAVRALRALFYENGFLIDLSIWFLLAFKAVFVRMQNF